MLGKMIHTQTVLIIERGLKIESIDFENHIEEADYIKS